MNFRTTSQLDPLNSLHYGGGETLFNVSNKNADGSYASKKVTFDQLTEAVVEQAVLSSEEKYSLDGFDGSAVQAQIGALLSGEATMQGKKIFAPQISTDFPEIRSQLPVDVRTLPDGAVMTKELAAKLVENRSAFVQAQSYLDFDPMNDNGYTKYDEDHLLMWNFDAGGRDSSEFIKDSQGGAPAGYVTCPHTGFLVCYGWLADQGGVKPAQAWVGLYGKINVPNSSGEGTAERDVLLQVQPWIIGSKSRVMQYVGFSLPVAEGMRLKIKTGFPVNGSQSGMDRDYPHLMTDNGSMINTFVGYVIRPGE